MRRIYAETQIAAAADAVWRYTQDPAMHARWDGRFGAISLLPATQPQRFRYSTFGVTGIGVAGGDRTQSDGGCISALRFSSEDLLSPIRCGSGYWRYVPTADGVLFLTGYDYRPGWGRAADLVVRPLMGWLTAWSFDRLRLWLEIGIPPESSRNQAIAEVAARIGLVLAASTHSVAAAMLVGVFVVTLPPLPTTPAARRGRRTPRHSAGARPPIIERLVPA